MAQSIEANSVQSMQQELEQVQVQSRAEAIQEIYKTFAIEKPVPLEEKTIKAWRCYVLVNGKSSVSSQYHRVEKVVLKEILELRARVRSMDFIPEEELAKIETKANSLNKLISDHGCSHMSLGPLIYVRYRNIPYEIKRRRAAINRENSFFNFFGGQSSQ